jgi:hypothetical protein
MVAIGVLITGVRKNKKRGHADAYRHLTCKVTPVLSLELPIETSAFLIGC